MALGTTVSNWNGGQTAFAQESSPEKPKIPLNTANAKVAVVRCTSYGVDVKKAYKECFDLLGGIGSLVKGKTVAVKINLTGTPYRDMFGKTSGETYLTHPDTVTALAAICLEEGARRVRIVECANYRQDMEAILEMAGWDIQELNGLGKVEFENTRNKGKAWSYATLPVSWGGYLFSSFELNHSYADTDVFISLAKMKNHATAGVTLSMKNVFGITPNSRYGDQAGSEEATAGRTPMHFSGGRWNRRKIDLPGAKEGDFPNRDTYRIPHIIADICAARPIHLSIIDGITSIRGGEGPWNRGVQFIEPGLLVAGLNPVSTDAVAVALMGYETPRAEQGVAPFSRCDNHLLLAEQCGLGTAELSRIEVCGLPIQDAVCSYETNKNS